MSASLDPEKQRKGKIYQRIQRRLMLVDLALGLLFILAWLFFGWGPALRDWLLQFTQNDWLLVAGFAAVFGLALFIYSLPLSYYSDFVLPHRFDLSTETLPGWIGDQVKGILMSAVLGGIILEIIYWLLRAAPQTWWLWAGGFMLIFTVLLANLAPIVLMPLFNKFTPLGEEHAELAERMKLLAQRAGTRLKGVFSMDMSRRTKAANAMLTGIGNTRRVILGDTLINEFTIDEIETVMAHELGHHVHRDVPVLIAFQTVLLLLGFYLASLGLAWGVAYFNLTGVGDVAGMPWLALVFMLYELITMPLGNTFSRWREMLADKYALESTGKPEAFASALSRLANQNLADVDPEPWVEYLLYSHPALSRRIAMAEEYSGTKTS